MLDLVELHFHHCIERAHIKTDSASDAQILIDLVRLPAFTGDGILGAVLFTQATSLARFCIYLIYKE